MKAPPVPPRRSAPPAPPQRGVALLGLLAVVALLGLAQWRAGTDWALAAQREREAQLLFVGEQYRRALASYDRMSPPGLPRQPRHLDELLADRRFARPVAHLRQRWPDPFTGRDDWVPIRAGDRIVGVHSRAEVAPLRQNEGRNAARVADWRFVHAGGAP
ncbi:type II secretion system protein [Ideonella sp. DXS22W]|uniref:Type II secretion system protein n=1 Tax=Pseudaquabacterium inlustre TaxID=2984192 RepID=A0ABU9CP40_9BURK